MVVTDQWTKSVESLDGDRPRLRDEDLRRHGAAERDQGDGRHDRRHHQHRLVENPTIAGSTSPASLFPMAHTIALIDRAKAGTRTGATIVETPIFDGDSDAEKRLSSTAVIGSLLTDRGEGLYWRRQDGRRQDGRGHDGRGQVGRGQGRRGADRQARGAESLARQRILLQFRQRCRRPSGPSRPPTRSMRTASPTTSCWSSTATAWKGDWRASSCSTAPLALEAQKSAARAQGRGRRGISLAPGLRGSHLTPIALRPCLP